MISHRRQIVKYAVLLRGMFYRGRFLNFIRMVSSFLFRKPDPKILPFILQIEPNTWCNLKCALCLIGRDELVRAQGAMDLNSFKKIIDALEDKIIYLGLYNLGEPLLNKDIYSMIGYAAQKKIYSRLSTNADFNKDTLKKLIHSRLDELVISLTCATPQTYARFKGKDNFAEIVSNVEYMVRERAGASRPLLNLQLLVTKDTEREIPIFKKLVRDLGIDKGLLKKIRINFPGMRFDRSYLPQKKRYLRRFYRKGYRGGVCYRPWISTTILWDGTVVPCCFDMEGQYAFGNMLHSEFRQIWQGNKCVAFRKNMFRADENNPICKECSVSGFLRDLSVFS